MVCPGSAPLAVIPPLLSALGQTAWDLGVFRSAHGSAVSFASQVLGDQKSSLCCNDFWRELPNFTLLECSGENGRGGAGEQAVWT